MILEVTCADPGIIQITKVLKTLFQMIQILGPILAMVSLGIIFFKSVVASDQKDFESNKKKIKNCIIALLITFFLPIFVNLTMAATFMKDTFEISSCWKEVDSYKNSPSKYIPKKTNKKGTGTFIIDPSKYKGTDENPNASGDTSDVMNSDYPAATASLKMALGSAAAATAPSYGSDLYVRIYDKVITDSSDYRTGKKVEASNGSTRYRSCSEAVAVAVRWSGTDDSFPQGGPAEQLVYLSNSSKWKRVNWGGDFSKLQPGDVFVDNRHAFMYVGKSLLHKYFPSAPADYDVTEANYNVDYNHQAKALYITHRADLNSSRWNVFRNIKRETNSKYTKYN